MKRINSHGMFFAAIVAAIMVTAACSIKEGKTMGGATASEERSQPGDSMVYGLACDGCSDTILVLLPLTGEDPDTFDILEASKAQQVFGRPMVGDKLAVMLNAEDKKVADLVVDIDKLKGEWCYLVTPQLRQRADFDPSTLSPEEKERMDTMLKKMMQPREYGIEIRSENSVRPIGTRTVEREGPAMFPPQKRYRQWHLFNGRLLLSETTRDTAGVVTVTLTDTAQFVMLRRDTMVLRFGDGEQGYYRRGVGS